MFGSNCAAPEEQFAGSVCAIGACGIGHSPPTVSDCVLARYGQNVTESESMTPAGQLASATRQPLTGFSGIGGLNVAPGDDELGHTAGPGVGSGIGAELEPTRRPQQSFCATAGA